MDHRNQISTLFVESLSSTHAITYVDGNLVGDPLDVKMFQCTGWVLDEMHDKHESKETASPSKHSDGPKADEGVVAYIYPKEAEGSKYRSALIRRFDFTSALMRMSVICRNAIDNRYRVFVKGSPEKIQELCLASSIPLDY
jgi:cation-transporting ATPase 13A2